MLKSVRSMDWKLLVNFYDYEYYEKVMAALASPAPVAAEVEVRVGCMTESNGNATWLVHLAKPSDGPFDALQIYASSVKGRAEYEAAKLRHFFGQGPEPDLLAYDTDESPVDSQTSKGK